MSKTKIKTVTMELQAEVLRWMENEAESRGITVAGLVEDLARKEREGGVVPPARLRVRFRGLGKGRVELSASPTVAKVILYAENRSEALKRLDAEMKVSPELAGYSLTEEGEEYWIDLNPEVQAQAWENRMKARGLMKAS